MCSSATKNAVDLGLISLWLWSSIITWTLILRNVSGHEMMGSTTTECEKSQTLRLLTSLPFPNSLAQFNPSWAQGPNILPAMHLAEEQINNNTHLLPCHKLELIVVDGGCDIAATTAVNTTIGLFNSTGVIGMIGPGCSASSIQAAHVMNQPEIELVQVHGAGSYLLNRTRYPNSIGILGSTQSFVDLSLALIDETGWHKIAVLYESNRVYYRSTKELFVEKVSQEKNVKILFDSPVYPTFYPLDGVRSSLARILFVFTAPSHSLRIMCLAYHMGMFYPAYQWVIISRRREDFINETDNDTYSFKYHNKDYHCSLREMLHVSLNRTFFLSYQVITTDTNEVKPKVGNITFNDFIRQHSNAVQTYWAYYFYDAVWAWAHVLDQLLIDKDGEFFNNYYQECIDVHSCFQYGNKTMANLILEKFYASDFEFEGMSGPINFNNSTGYNNRPVNLYQIVDGEEVYIPLNSDKLETISDSFRSVELVSPGLIAFFVFLLFLLFFIILSLHVLTVMYRNFKSVKASSPNLSHFAFTGTYLVLFGCMLFIFINVREHSPEVSGPICHTVWVWFFPIGFTLVIGTVIVRSWRLYRIFVHYLDPGRFISNFALITILVAMVSVDVLVAVIWTAVDPRKLMMVSRTVEVGSARGLEINRICRSEKQESVWLVMVMSYKVVQFIALVTLTLLTRHNVISNKTFANNSLRLFSYTFSAVFGIGFALYYCFLYFQRTTHANIKYSILYLTLSTLMLLYIMCVFVPPLTPIIRDKITKKKLEITQASKAMKRPARSTCSDQRKTSEEALL